MKDLPTDELPREKALKHGIYSLSDVELMAIILRTGTRNCSVKELSINILNESGGLKGLQDMRVSKISEIYGVGRVKAITLLAAIELGKRLNIPEEKKLLQIKESKDVFQYYSHFFQGEKQEKFMVLFLNSKNEVINHKILFIGTANQSLIHSRDIFQEAILNNSVKIICIHNHPSGNVYPSLEDEIMTKKIIESGQLLNIQVVDHIIIGRNLYYSFLEHGKVD